MADIVHAFAFLTGLPFTGTNITLDSAGAAMGTTVRIEGGVSYKKTHRHKEEDINESGHLVGERRFDTEETLTLTLKLPTSSPPYAAIQPGFKTIIASLTGTASTYNGNWQIEDIGHEWKADGAIMVPVTLRRNESLTLSVQNA